MRLKDAYNGDALVRHPQTARAITTRRLRTLITSVVVATGAAPTVVVSAAADFAQPITPIGITLEFLPSPDSKDQFAKLFDFQRRGNKVFADEEGRSLYFF